VVGPILHESLVEGEGYGASLVLEPLQSEGFFPLHFFKPKLDEHLGFLKFGDDLELESVHTPFGGFNLCEETL
jgi:hypothetical protein